jgi:H+-transporting ATPase
VFGNQATIYTNRERRHLWSFRPSFWVIVSSVADLLIVSKLAIGGIAMTPLLFAVMPDLVKVAAFRRLKIT